MIKVALIVFCVLMLASIVLYWDSLMTKIKVMRSSEEVEAEKAQLESLKTIHKNRAEAQKLSKQKERYDEGS